MRWDEAGALGVLNDMLINENSTTPFGKSTKLWEASADDEAKYCATALGELEELLKKEAETKMSQRRKAGELLPVLQKISEGLKGTAQLEGLKKQIEHLTEEKEKYLKGLRDAEERNKELQNHQHAMYDVLRERDEQLANLEGILKVARASEKKWKAQAQHLEAENQEKMMMLDRAEQDKKKLKDELDALKAKMKKMQDEDARAEE
ncbi:PREDICTED: CAP-Gly domain-containing linker protein 1-like [Branchiostoma belcheri]|uniref:CAP-Gly domain-containing linker protein 1-like n=1 Tax=Branchiostoma belcheri TaxID=7741 RepID=A0A6P4ZFP4_BRABE|nr:PREDICTED: CAP-Gly domain-containing linker protein 1-like [Branchiostoma belcheri]